MRRDIEFQADDAALRGWMYLPDRVGEHDTVEPLAAIVMAHGFSAVKEQYLDRYAESFAAAGFAVVVYDNRNFGASDGTPRQEIDPVQQARDYRHAITFACIQPEVDPARIGIWGTSFSGGHVLAVAAHDRRVKCVVSQVPTISGPEAGQRRTRADLVPGLLAALDADRLARFEGKPPGTLAVVAEQEETPCALPGPESWGFFDASASFSPAWQNLITLRSVDMAREYEPGVGIHRISPTPLLMIVADRDYVTPTDLALDGYARARHPKKLVLLQGGHFTPYVEHFEQSSRAAIAWFSEHLTP